MKNVLVTGADGFIGSHLVEMLVQKGHKVRALSLYNSFNTWGWLEDSKYLKDIEVVTGDVRDPFFCRDITKGVDSVFHLAALIAIPYSYVAPQSYIETNITGTVNICKAALDHGVQRVIHTSTSEVYGTARYVPIDEAHPLQPQSPYSASKISADAMAMSFFNAFNLPLTIARPFNTFGPRQSARAVIPTIISQLLSGKKSINLGDVTPTRDFNFVTDTCRGFLALASSSDTIGKTVNIGSNREVTILETFNMIKGILGSNAEIQVDQQRIRPEKSEVHRLWCDNTLIKKLTGYEPQVTFEEGLKQTVEWFSEPKNIAKYKTDIYNV
ncbi:NAD-dependent 4,6-dehydratase LegB [Bdellovibrio sp. HCB337]|uniref:NAD-dependent 4,6-dehydratase LegB n=1 Tax=Bdellovibrio sp. HCB337 TaxID=3394358 RepID=UPI0039A4924F